VPSDGTASPPPAGRIPALDALRGIAILLVIWHNTGLAGGRTEGLVAKLFVAGANAGWVGVQLFFVLSGFLITGILLDARGHPHAWRNFMARRALRIFPLYFLVLAIGFLLLPAVGMLPPWLARDHAHQVWYWTYLVNWSAAWGLSGPGFGHFWSLAVEEQFYLAWPLAALLLTRRQLGALCVILIGSALGFRLLARDIMPTAAAATEAAYAFTVARWDALALGALLAIGMRSSGWAARVPLATTLAGAIGGLAALGLAAAHRGFGNMSWPVLTWGQSAAGLLSVGVVASAAARGAAGRSPMARLAEQRWLRTLGKYSYALYIFHLPVAHLLRLVLPADLDALGAGALVTALAGYGGVVLLASLVLAWLSWRLIEAPAQALKRHFPT
jgi:peptidoglycan/LPS O-acetylase OafA/YrhL